MPKLPLVVVVALHSNCVEVEHFASLVLDEVEQRSRLTRAVVRVPDNSDDDDDDDGDAFDAHNDLYVEERLRLTHAVAWVAGR